MFGRLGMHGYFHKVSRPRDCPARLGGRPRGTRSGREELGMFVRLGGVFLAATFVGALMSWAAS